MIYWDRIKYVDRADSNSKRPFVWVVCEECSNGRWVRWHDAKKLRPEHWCGECGPRMVHWKGGRRTRPDGYVFILAPEGHPYPAYTKPSGAAYILEHRLIMERHLGRRLKPGEVVHHKNGNPSDNRIENLALCTSQAEHIREQHGNTS